MNRNRSRDLETSRSPRAGWAGMLVRGGRAALTLSLLSATALAPLGCVSQRQHDEVLADLQRVRAEAGTLGRRVAALTADVARLEKDVQTRDARIAEMTTAQADLIHKLDDLAVMNAELSDRLRNAGQSVEQLANERGSLEEALATTRARLEQLSKLQAAAEARSAQFRDLAARLKKMVDAGQLQIAMRDGRMLIELPNDVLFDSGKTELKPVGKSTLGEIARVLKTMTDRRFQVAGHTDNVAIKSARFPSNWELSTSRAVEVTKLLIASGMNAKNVSAAGYGEFDPIASNETPEGRAHNRRIEISLVPNLDEVFQLPETKP